jgi:predicted unusual protein kinase regulating ubiquinone biosynthesis (AarF/ABC1/UbiB family)
LKPSHEPIDHARSLRVSWFFARVFLTIAVRDVLCDRPGLRLLRGNPDERWRRMAVDFRRLALRLGGVLIKLGQFLSARADVLPPSITEPLADLQDEVPAVPFAAIASQIEAELGVSLASVFGAVDEIPLGAASIAQAHAATLPDGRPIVLKVLRPGIERIVETDLTAIGRGVSWLKLFGAIRRRVDLDRLHEEFSRVTRLELDLEHEGRNAERFAAAHVGDPVVLVPRVDWSLSRRRLLALENVAAIKVADLPALVAAGVDLPSLAREVNRIFLEQVFITHLVHADPHPGNLFVHPATAERPLRLALVDFGMVVEVPETMQRALRDYLVGLGTRDAGRVVQAFRDAGVLLPGADFKRIEQAHEDLLERFWGIPLGELQDVALGQADALWDEYRDLLRELPFQVPIDLLFVGRAAGLISGLATRLDPAFDPWSQIGQFALKLENGGVSTTAKVVTDAVVDQARLAWTLPKRLDRLVGEGLRGRLRVEAALAPETRRTLDRLEAALARLGWTVLGATFLVLAVLGPEPWRWWWGAAGAGAAIAIVARR